MRKVDTSSYSAKKPTRVKPEKVDLGDLPPIENHKRRPQKPLERKESDIQRKSKKSVDQSIDQSIDRSIDRSISQEEIGPIVQRPRGFYITQKVDHWLDKAVARLKDRGVHKADRSVVVNALLHNPELYKTSSIIELEKVILRHLANKYRTRRSSQLID